MKGWFESVKEILPLSRPSERRFVQCTSAENMLEADVLLLVVD